MAGQEGFEPPAPGFGVRCSNRCSCWPVEQSGLLLGLLVRRVSLAEPAIFLKLEPVGSLLLVFRRRIVSLLALRAGKRNDVSHSAALLHDIADDAGAHGPAALSNRESKLFLHRDRRDQLNG